MHAFLVNPITKAALGGFLAGFAVDLRAYMQRKDGVPYDWGVAVARCLEGAVSAAAAVAGYGGLVG
jgi:hypothetical protein